MLNLNETKYYLACYGIPQSNTSESVQSVNRLERSKKCNNVPVEAFNIEYAIVLAQYTNFESGEVYTGESIRRVMTPFVGDNLILDNIEPCKSYMVTRIQDSITFTQQESK
jgi:hypothetical protein